jgi:hypothetical protein
MDFQANNQDAKPMRRRQRFFLLLISALLAVAAPLSLAHAGELTVKCTLKTFWGEHDAGSLQELALTDLDGEEWNVFRTHCDFSLTQFLFLRGEIDRNIESVVNNYYALLMVKTGGQQDANQRLIVLLTSDGGSLNAALRIGRLLHNMQAAVYVDKSCLSACVFVLAGGVKRYAYGAVGVHRPFNREHGADHSLSPEAQDEEPIRKKAVAYLKDMHVPAALYDLMNSVPSRSIHILDAQDLKRYGLHEIDAPRMALAERGEEAPSQANGHDAEDDDTYAHYPSAERPSTFDDIFDVL